MEITNFNLLFKKWAKSAKKYTQTFQEEIGETLKLYAVNEDLAKEVEMLRKENEELRKYY